MKSQIVVEFRSPCGKLLGFDLSNEEITRCRRTYGPVRMQFVRRYELYIAKEKSFLQKLVEFFRS